MLDLLAWAAAVEASPLGLWAREDRWAYPIANIVHLLALVTLVGGIGVVDLRLAGAWPRLPVAALSAALTPVALAGLALAVMSGAVLFAADAGALVRQPVFGWKLLLVGFALANAVALRLSWGPAWPSGAAVRAAALLSLGLWLTVGTLGRLIAYV